MTILLPAVSGRAYFTPGAYTTFTVPADTLYATPFRAPPGGLTPTKIGVRVTTAGVGAGADVRFGIYKDAGGRPGELLADFGAVTDLTGTGAYSVDISYGGSVTPRPFMWDNQVYWLASLWNTAATTQPTVAALDSATTPQANAAALGVVALANLPAQAATAGVALSASLAYGALPASAPAMTVILNAKAPLVGLLAG